MHQIHSNNYKGNYELQLITNVHQHSTRFSKTANYYRQTTTLNTTQQALTVAGPKLWSEIPAEIKLLNYNQFVSKYKQHLIDIYSR